MSGEGETTGSSTPAADMAADASAAAPPADASGTPPPDSTPGVPGDATLPPPPAAPPKPRKGALRCMGKKPPRHDHRTLQLGRYLPTSLPAPPKSTNNRAAVTKPWGMMVNDKLGDCTGAAAGHAEQGWTANNGAECEVTDQDVVDFYSGSTGYNPDDPSTDQGGVELDVLAYWRKVGIAGKKIKAFVALEPKNHEHIQQTVYLFRGCYIGLALPESAQDQDDWEVDESGENGSPDPGSWGGHAVWVVDYDAKWLYVVTWGEIKRMSWRFWNLYCDESYAVLAEEAEAPKSFDYAQLEADLAVVSDPRSSLRAEVAAAAHAALAAGAVPAHDVLTVTRRLQEDGIGEVVAVNRAGVYLGLTMAPVADPDGSMEDSMITVRLMVGGQGHAVAFQASELGKFAEATSDLFRDIERSMRKRRAPPEQPEQEPPAGEKA